MLKYYFWYQESNPRHPILGDRANVTAAQVGPSESSHPGCQDVLVRNEVVKKHVFVETTFAAGFFFTQTKKNRNDKKERMLHFAESLIDEVSPRA